jgi:hypothetical protein
MKIRSESIEISGVHFCKRMSNAKAFPIKIVWKSPSSLGMASALLDWLMRLHFRLCMLVIIKSSCTHVQPFKVAAFPQSL